VLEVLNITMPSLVGLGFYPPPGWPKTLSVFYRQHCAQRNLIYSEADFEVFRAAGAIRCTDGGEIRHGGGDQSPLPCQLPPPSVQRQGCTTPKIEIFAQI